jgi:hypothetical protein
MLAVAIDQAEAQAAQSFNEVATNLWANLSAVRPVVAGIVMIILGVGFLLYGYPLYKLLVIIIFAAAGFFVGIAASAALGLSPVIGMIAGPLVLGLLAWPLVRLAWGLLGGAAFAIVFAGFAKSSGVASQGYLYLIGSVSFLAGLIVTFLLVRPLIIILTSVTGALLLVEGSMQILAKLSPTTGERLAKSIADQPWIMIAIVLPIAIIGALLQFKHKQVVGEGGGGGGKKSRKSDKKGGDE